MLDPRRPAWPSGERTPGPGTGALFPGQLGPSRPAWAAGTGEGRLARVSGELARQSLGVRRRKSNVVIKVQALEGRRRPAKS